MKLFGIPLSANSSGTGRWPNHTESGGTGSFRALSCGNAVRVLPHWVHQGTSSDDFPQGIAWSYAWSRSAVLWLHAIDGQLTEQHVPTLPQ